MKKSVTICQQKLKLCPFDFLKLKIINLRFKIPPKVYVLSMVDEKCTLEKFEHRYYVLTRNGTLTVYLLL